MLSLSEVVGTICCRWKIHQNTKKNTKLCFFGVLVYLLLFVMSCQYQCKWCLKRLVSDLTKRDLKLYSLTHSLTSRSSYLLWILSVVSVKKGKAIDLCNAFLCTPKAGGQATSNALLSLTGAAGHPGHCPKPAHTGLGSDPTDGQAAPVSSRSPPS